VRRSSSLRYLPGAAVELCYGDLATGWTAGSAGWSRDVFHVAGVTKASSSREYYQATQWPPRTCCGLALRAAARAPPGTREQPGGGWTEPGCRAADGGRGAAPFDPLRQVKLEAELAVRQSRLAGSAVIVRPPVVYGPRDTDVYQVLRGIAKGYMLRIGRAESFFSYIYVKDLAEALVAAASSRRRPEEPSSQPIPSRSPEGIRALAASILGRKVRTVPVPAAAAYALGWMAEMASRMRGKPGFSPARRCGRPAAGTGLRRRQGAPGTGVFRATQLARGPDRDVVVV